jgi:glycosyltransferase involved in cell wall biosynthesis
MTADAPLRVTWLGHGAERTGPPIYLLRLLEGLQAHPEIAPSVVLLEGGPLLEPLRALAPVTVVGERPLVGARRAAAAALSRVGAAERAGALVAGTSAPEAPDVVVVNTAGSIRALPALGAPPRRLITHVHELATGLEYWLDPELRARCFAADEIWVVADAVGEHLVERHGIDPDRLRVHRGLIPPDALTPDPGAASELRSRLELPPDTVLLGASGTLDWRKAPDLLLEVVARAARRARAPLHLVWIGGDPASPWARLLGEGARRAGLAHPVHHLPEADRPDRWFGALDLLVLPSREDAYPLVCLEAAAAGVPTVGFDSGGLRELVRAGGGTVVAHPDVDALAALVADLADRPDERRRLGALARTAAAGHTASHALPPMIADLRRIARGPR